MPVGKQMEAKDKPQESNGQQCKRGERERETGRRGAGKESEQEGGRERERGGERERDRQRETDREEEKAKEGRGEETEREVEEMRRRRGGGGDGGPTPHLVEDLLLGLGLLDQVGEGTARGDELLDVLDVLLLLLVLLPLDDLLLLDRLLEGGVVTGVVLELLLREPDRVGADAVEEVLRVGDEHEALVVLAQVVLEPHAGLEVQMVGRLVEQQQRGAHEEGAGEGHAHAPPSRHVLGGAGHHGLVEAEAVEQHRGTDLEGRGGGGGQRRTRGHCDGGRHPCEGDQRSTLGGRGDLGGRGGA